MRDALSKVTSQTDIHVPSAALTHLSTLALLEMIPEEEMCLESFHTWGAVSKSLHRSFPVVGPARCLVMGEMGLAPAVTDAVKRRDSGQRKGSGRLGGF